MKVVLYARVSSDKQDVDLSLSAQLKALREYCARKGYTIVKEFIDSAESGRTAYRPQFREMISLARKSDQLFDMILVYKYSRFARSREDSIVYKALLKKNGVQLVSITEPVDDTAMGRLMQAIIECIDEFYSENLGEEVTRGMRESASRGFYLSSRPPYGYHKVKVNDGGKQRTKLELDEFQSKVVQAIFDKVVKGNGLTEIAKDLNSRGIPSPTGNSWGKTGLHSILQNEIYTGTLVWGRNSKRGLPEIRVENAYPGCISIDTFREALDMLKQRSFIINHPRRTASPFLLSGIARCGHCGKALVGAEAKSSRYSYYICGSLLKKGSNACPTHYLSTRNFDGLIIDKIKHCILTPKNLTNLAEMVTAELNSQSREYEDELISIQNELVEVRRRLDRLYDAIETGRLSLDELAPRIREVKERYDKLETRKSELELIVSGEKAEVVSKEEVAECVHELSDLLQKGSLLERKAFIQSFVKEVKVYDKEIKLIYSFPALPEGINEELLSVPSIVHSGGR